MKPGEQEISLSANRLRHEFDRSFAEAPGGGAALFEDFLAVRIGGDPYAIRLSDVTGLHRDRKIVPVATHASHLLGVASFRGATAPIYDLRALLGYSGGAPPRWLVLARAPASIGFAFDTLEKHLRIKGTSAQSMETGDHARRYVHGVVRSSDGTFSLIQLASIVEAITRDLKV